MACLERSPLGRRQRAPPPSRPGRSSRSPHFGDRDRRRYPERRINHLVRGARTVERIELPLTLFYLRRRGRHHVSAVVNGAREHFTRNYLPVALRRHKQRQHIVRRRGDREYNRCAGCRDERGRLALRTGRHGQWHRQSRGRSHDVWYFEYGLATSHGARTTSRALGANPNNVYVAAALSDLAPRSTYHYRIVAISASGTTRSADSRFTTGLSVALNTSPSDVVYGGFATLSVRSRAGALELTSRCSRSGLIRVPFRRLHR